MGTLFSTLDIARSGMQAAQIQLEVASHNIANVNRTGYSRQRVDLGTNSPVIQSYGQLGRGVRVMTIERLRETFLDTVYRQQSPSLGNAVLQATYFTRLEDLFQEPSEQGFSQYINTFFDSLNDFANNVEEQPVRMSVVTEAQNLAASLNQLAQGLFSLRTNANEEVRNLVPQLNNLADRIAQLNQAISQSEVNNSVANDLRDERDNLLDELSSYINISFRERVGGMVDVLVGGELLVNGNEYCELAAVRDPTIDPDRGDLVTVRFAESGQAVDVRDGRLYGAINVRDDVLVGLADRLDEITAMLIYGVNRIQSTGNGLDNLSGLITATNAVSDPADPLSGAGLPFAVAPGTFDVVVYDGSGVPTTTTVTLAADATAASLVADLNTIANFSAAIGPANTLQLGASGGYTFCFANDTSGVLTALGINGLFTGHTAGDIAVSSHILDNPRLLASGYSLDVLETGDNSAALELAGIRNQLLMGGGTATINGFYESMIVELGVDSRANLQLMDMQQALVDDYQRRRDEVSGVSIDEEVTNMLQFQRAYEASARVVTVVDRMIEALFNAVS